LKSLDYQLRLSRAEFLVLNPKLKLQDHPRKQGVDHLVKLPCCRSRQSGCLIRPHVLSKAVRSKFPLYVKVANLNLHADMSQEGTAEFRLAFGDRPIAEDEPQSLSVPFVCTSGIHSILIRNGSDGGGVVKKWIETRYYTPLDNMEQPIDYDAGVNAAGLLSLVGYRVAQQDQCPAWNRDDFFGNEIRRDHRKPRKPDTMLLSHSC
jgi:hypothetical protein